MAPEYQALLGELSRQQKAGDFWSLEKFGKAAVFLLVQKHAWFHDLFPGLFCFLFRMYSARAVTFFFGGRPTPGWLVRKETAGPGNLRPKNSFTLGLFVSFPPQTTPKITILVHIGSS